MANANGLLLFAQGQPDQIPGKVFDYLRIDRPIFAIAEDGETKKILKPVTNAFVADPNSVEDIASKFQQMLSKIGSTENYLGVGGDIQQYGRRDLTRKLVSLLEQDT